VLLSNTFTSTSYTTLLKLTKCLQTNIETNIKTITTYLVRERALEAVQAVIRRISNMYKQRVKQRTIEQAIC
jgi:hypothetical protein